MKEVSLSKKKGINIFGLFLGKNEVFRFGLVISNIFLLVLARMQSIQLNEQSEQIQTLTVTKAYLLAQNRSTEKGINETPLSWWKKEYFPEDNRIIMVDYNDAFYEYFLSPLNLSRYDYVRQPDSKFFPEEVAQVFFDEDLDVLAKYLAQPEDSLGDRPLYIEEFGNHWVDPSGNVNKDGYFRFAIKENGHYYIWGMLKKPKPSKKLKVVKSDIYVKPDNGDIAEN